MYMSKKITLLILVVIMIITFNSCSGNGSYEPQNISSSSVLRFRTELIGEPGIQEYLTAAFSGVQGCNGAFVGYHSSTIDVYFDENVSTDFDAIEKIVAGKKLVVKSKIIVSSEEMAAERLEKQKEAEKYIGCIVGSNGQVRAYLLREHLELGISTMVNQYKKQYGEDFFQTSEGKSVYNEILGTVLVDLVDDAIWYAQMKNSSFDITRDEFDRLYTEKVVRRNNLSSEEELQQMINSSGYNYEYFKLRNSNMIYIHAFMEDSGYSDGIEGKDLEKRRDEVFKKFLAEAQIEFFDPQLDAFYVERDCGCDE